MRNLMWTGGMVLAVAVAGTACKDPTEGKAKAAVEDVAENATDKAPTGDKAAPAGDAAATKSAADLASAEDKQALAAGKTFGPDTGSSVGFVGSKVTGSHEGKFEKFSGKLALKDGKLPQAVSVDIDMGSVTTDADKLTKHLQTGDFFQVAQYPTATFYSTSIEEGGDAGVTHVINGHLTMRGVTKKVSFPAKATFSDKQIEVSSEFSINRKDWGIVYPGKPDDLIRDQVLLKLHIVVPR